MERFEQREAVAPEEIERMRRLPQGRAMATDYLLEKNYDLAAEINKNPAEIREYLMDGMQEIFINNIQLPMDEQAVDINLKALSGLMLIKKEKEMVLAVYEQLKHLFSNYEQASTQAYGQLKEQYRAKIMDAAKTMGYDDITEQSAEPERYPGFREDWLRTRARVNDQYQNLMQEQKNKLREIE
jgi:hypothetical protein